MRRELNHSFDSAEAPDALSVSAPQGVWADIATAAYNPGLAQTASAESCWAKGSLYSDNPYLRAGLGIVGGALGVVGGAPILGGGVFLAEMTIAIHNFAYCKSYER